LGISSPCKEGRVMPVRSNATTMVLKFIFLPRV